MHLKILECSISNLKYRDMKMQRDDAYVRYKVLVLSCIFPIVLLCVLCL